MSWLSAIMTTYKDEEKFTERVEQFEKLVAPQASPRQYKWGEIQWFNMLVLLIFHTFGLYGLYLCFTSAKWQTILFAHFLYCASILGAHAGAHRLWSHRAFKAKLPLQILLMLMHSLSYQTTVICWARDHRFHHKYTDTDADPHNITRGMFYSHFGWLLVPKHPEMRKRFKTVDWKDLADNPVLQFQTKYFVHLSVAVFIFSIAPPMYLWGETFTNAFFIFFLRLVCSLNGTFIINSAAHKLGYKPYDDTISPTQNHLVSWINLGEGFHNYHHVFPFDYRAGELGNNCLNMAVVFIDFFAWIGWAYDLKTAPDDMIKKRAKRSGDGTDLWGRENKNIKDMPDVNEEIANFNDLY